MKQKGVTLIEILVAMSVFVIASIIIFSFIKNAYNVQSFSFEQSSAITEARRGVETMIKEIRETLPGDNGAYPIISASDQEFIFYADFDKDDAIERVHYWLDGSNFTKSVTEASGNPLTYDLANEKHEIISKYVRNNEIPIFTYRDGDYTDLETPADPDSIRLVHVYLNINVTPNKAPLDFDLESDVSIRNLKDNL